ncbi:hypothetical protein RAS1_12490 [Phycisphaerae bacterium RAS1]|nr:hypothetical protein RAS1_12490 [Phycisphaerae bacterium RAS1]
MTHEAFEKLLSAWLDEPSDEWRAQIDAAAGGDGELARAREAWLRLDALLRQPRELERVNWSAFQRVVCESLAVEAGQTDERRLDRALGSLPDIVPIIDWDRLKHRIGDSVSASMVADPPPARTIRMPWQRRAAIGAMLAAAAVLAVFAFIPRAATPLPLGGAGIARLLVSPAAVAAVGASRVEITLARLDDAPPAPADRDEEIFLMIDPADSAPALAASSDRVGFF